MAKKKRGKAGASKAAAAAKRDLFIKAFIVNGGNATQAAIAAGYSKKTAYSAGGRLLKHVEIAAAIEKNRESAAEKAGLTVERTLQEIARIAYFDTRNLYAAEGGLKAPADWDDATAAAVSHMGRLGPVPHDKNAALEKAMKHLGLYGKNNEQIGESLALHVAFGNK